MSRHIGHRFVLNSVEFAQDPCRQRISRPEIHRSVTHRLDTSHHAPFNGDGLMGAFGRPIVSLGQSLYCPSGFETKNLGGILWLGTGRSTEMAIASRGWLSEAFRRHAPRSRLMSRAVRSFFWLSMAMMSWASSRETGGKSGIDCEPGLRAVSIGLDNVVEGCHAEATDC